MWAVRAQSHGDLWETGGARVHVARRGRGAAGPPPTAVLRALHCLGVSACHHPPAESLQCSQEAAFGVHGGACFCNKQLGEVSGVGVDFSRQDNWGFLLALTGWGNAWGGSE